VQTGALLVQIEKIILRKPLQIKTKGNGLHQSENGYNPLYDKTSKPPDGGASKPCVAGSTPAWRTNKINTFGVGCNAGNV